MSIKMQLLGAPELMERFKKLNNVVATDYIQQSVQEGADYMKEQLERKTPRRTGALASAYRLVTEKLSRNTVKMTISVNPNQFYWRFLEFGTKWRSGAHGGKRKMEPHPWIKKIFKNRKGTARQVIRDTFRDLVLGFKG
jgi:HK97 gp10 family phage protein